VLKTTKFVAKETLSHACTWKQATHILLVHRDVWIIRVGSTLLVPIHQGTTPWLGWIMSKRDFFFLWVSVLPFLQEVLAESFLLCNFFNNQEFSVPEHYFYSKKVFSEGPLAASSPPRF
jgi:hypothetical protein